MSTVNVEDMLGVAPTHIYVSGPMRAKDGFNFPAFFEVEAALRERWPEADIFNPAREDVVRFNLQDLLAADPTGLAAGRHMKDSAEFGPVELRDAIGRDLDYICRHGDMIVLLPEWQASSGAQAELACCQALGIAAVEWERLSEALTAEQVDEDTEETPQEAPEGLSAPPASDSEVRVTSATGGQKGTKLAKFSQVSPEVEMLIAEHFGKGALKYDAHNFRKGYPWSLSYDALRRHLAAFWSGKEYDNHLPSCPEGCLDHTGSLHIVAVIWHAMVLTEFYLHRSEYDDRYVYANHE